MLDQLVRPAKNLIRAPYRKLRASYTRLRYGFGPAELLKLLRDIGIRSGDAVFVHSSMDGFRGFSGSVSDIVKAFEEAVGPNGNVLMPTLSFSGSAIDYATSNRIFDPRTSASQVGLLTEVFRRSPDVSRSVHPTHSVAVWGADRDWWIKDHPLADTPCGRGTPFDRLQQRGGKIVLAGVTIGCLTHFHYAEEILEPHMPFSPFTTERYTMRCRVNGEVIGTNPMRLYDRNISRRRRLAPLAAELRKAGQWKEGKAGTLSCTILNTRAILETLKEMADRGVYCYELQ